MKNQLQRHQLYFIVYGILLLITSFFIATIDKESMHLYLNSFHNNLADFFFQYTTHIGDGMAIVVVAVLLLFNSKRKTIQVALSGVFAGFIAQILKKVVFGPTARPSAYFKDLGIDLYFVDGVDLHTAFSFPSGHSTAIFAMMTALVLFQKSKKFDILFIVIAFLVAYSRVYLSQHFVIDIYVGSIIGTVSAILVYSFVYSPKMLAKKKLDNPLINFSTNKA